MVIYPVKHVSWGEVTEWSLRLARIVGSSGFKPDVVVAVGRGGLVVSRILADVLDIDKILYLPIRWREGFRKPGESYLAELIRCFAKGSGIELCIADVVKSLSIETVFSFETNLSGSKALAVEEISATGLHLAKAREILVEKWGAGDVKTATLVWKASTSQLKPDYVFIETRSFVWFQFPWSRASDYKQFAKVAMEEECRREGKCSWSIEEIGELFKKWYGFNPDKKYLEIALEKLTKEGILNRVNKQNVTVYETRIQ